MEMKDRLIRTHHGKAHYYLKKTGIYSSIVLGAFILVAIPVSMVRSIVKTSDKNIEVVEENSVNFSANSLDELIKF